MVPTSQMRPACNNVGLDGPARSNVTSILAKARPLSNLQLRRQQCVGRTARDLARCRCLTRCSAGLHHPQQKNRSPAYSRTSPSSLSSFRMPHRRRYISPIRHSCGVITPADPRVPHHRVTQAALAPLEGEAEDSGRSWRPLWRAIRRRWRLVRRDHCTST